MEIQNRKGQITIVVYYLEELKTMLLLKTEPRGVEGRGGGRRRVGRATERYR
ncbi:hypothetical protein A2U01_0049033, partial [Trifolium medium]|nr:hypothetical protein [Trifolium medium]